MACSSVQGGLLLQLPSVGPKSLFSSNSAPVNILSTSSSSRRCSRMRPSVFSTRDLRPQLDEYPEGIISGEWTENFSLLSYEDLRAYLESQIEVHKVLVDFTIDCCLLDRCVFRVCSCCSVCTAGPAKLTSRRSHVNAYHDGDARSDDGGG